jgi:hypothetical protein
VIAYFDVSGVDFTDAHSIADSVEIQLIAADESYLSYSEYRSLFSSSGQPSANDMEVGFAEIETRALRIGRHYPFLFDGQGVAFDRTAAWQLYGFLLLLSLRGTPLRTQREWPRSDPIFDRLVLRAFQANYPRGLHFGWPPRDDRPPTFPEALRWAADEMGLGLRASSQPLPTHRADGGVDVIVWNPYPDGATGFPVLLVQNTIKQDYAGKPGDVDTAQWRDWIQFGNTPAVGFAVPFFLSADDPWRPQVVSRVLDFMDRGRLISKLQGHDPAGWEDWGELSAFVEDQLSQIRDEASGDEATVSPQRGRKKAPRPPK